MKPKIIVIDYDRQNRKLISSLLEKEHEVYSASSFAEGYSLILSTSPDIIIIDPEYPKKAGIELIESVRKFSDCPIIALSLNGTELAAVTAINAGADDFIRKPFFSDELKARVKSCVRRIELLQTAKGISKSSVYRNGELTVDDSSQTCLIKNEHIHLTKNEFKILTLLCRHCGKVLTYDFILTSVWGPRSGGNTGILRVNIANLRKKLEKDPINPEYIFTENGIGYRMAENEEN